eukprot:Rhum_TRINITY_DN14298_c3_g2::Rhum_TRINITY_DN14298_c3_g2_i1::g.73202::m.73202
MGDPYGVSNPPSAPPAPSAPTPPPHGGAYAAATPPPLPLSTPPSAATTFSHLDEAPPTGAQPPLPVLRRVPGHPPSHGADARRPSDADARAQCAMLHSLGVHVEVHINTAFVALRGRFRVPTHAGEGAFEFLVPMTEDASATSCTLHLNPQGVQGRGPSSEMFHEMVVAEPQKAGPQDGGRAGGAGDTGYSEYDPSVIRLPLTLSACDVVDFSVTYMQPMQFDCHTGVYTLVVPLNKTNSRYSTYLEGSLSDICHATCHVVSLGAMREPDLLSVPLVEMGASAAQNPYFPSMDLWLHTTSGDWDNKDLRLSYRLASEQITACLLVEDLSSTYEIPSGLPPESVATINASDLVAQRFAARQAAPPGTTPLAVLLNPPAAAALRQQQGGSFARSLVFVLDRSGSMAGGLLAAAKDALGSALRNLQQPSPGFPGDSFSIIMFNHEHAVITRMQKATPAAVSEAVQTLQAVTAGGTTNMAGPVQEAYDILLSEPPGQLPFLVLITDGCVHDEHRIVSNVRKMQLEVRPGMQYSPRILTFGLGKHCNTFFLKMMAALGRGHTGTALDASHSATVRARLLRLLDAASGPCLTNIKVTDDQGRELQAELTPHPIPDLTAGAPLVVAGRLPAGVAVKSLTIHGTLPSGSFFAQQIHPVATSMPLSKLFAKKTLDSILAQMWYERMLGHTEAAHALEEKAIETSVVTGVPCAVTNNYLIPMTPKQHQAYVADKQAAESAQKRRDVSKLVVAGAVGAGVVVGACLAATVAFGMTDAALSGGVLDAVGSFGGGGGRGVSGGGDVGSGCCDPCCDAACDDCDCDCDGCDGCDGCDFGGC